MLPIEGAQTLIPDNSLHMTNIAVIIACMEKQETENENISQLSKVDDHAHLPFCVIMNITNEHESMRVNEVNMVASE